MEREVFGKYIEEKRKQLGITQGELAEKLFVTNKAVSKWENGKSYPYITIFEPLAAELRISISELMTCGGEKTQDEPEKTLIAIMSEKMKKNKQKLVPVLIILGAVLLIVFANLLKKAEEDNYPYVYNRGWHYYITDEIIEDKSTIGEYIGEVTKTGIRRSDKHNMTGDSNVASIGTEIYVYNEPKPEPGMGHYLAPVAIKMPDTDEYRVVCILFESIQDGERYFGINVGHAQY